jgi:ubiquitin C-terminal hydrolase
MYASITELNNSESDVKEQRKKLTVRGLSGLKNQGNTCYMNSILQCLASLDLFRSWLVKGEYQTRLQNNMILLINNIIRKTKNIPDDQPVSISKSEIIRRSENTVVYKLAEVFTTMWYRNSIVTPEGFKKIIGDNSTTFKGYSQNDSQELLNLILDKTHEETKAEVIAYFPEVPEGVFKLLEIRKKCNEILLSETVHDDDKLNTAAFLKNYKKEHTGDTIICNALTFWRDYITKSHSIITDLFTGLLYSQIVCGECGTLSTTFDPFTILPVQTKDDGQTSLDESLREFSKEELLTGEDRYSCEECQKKVIATKKICIWEPPNILIVQLKRFKNDSYRTTKTSSKVVFPIQNFDIKDYLCELHSVKNTIYDLVSISEHRGTCNFGHYVAYCKNSLNGKWYEFNDDDIIHVPDNDLANEIVTKNAYILFYVRRKKN